MTKRICWKKGMRLTDEILRASDNAAMEFVGNAFVLAAAGRFGLFPTAKPFELSLNIIKGLVDVESLTCLAITKGGDLIDVNYDSKYTNTFDTRVQIPETNGEKELILTIDSHDGQWKDANNGYEEPEYSFSLLTPNSPVPANSLPIARIVDEYGWRMDDIDFVPPCLFVTSHPKYIDLLQQFSNVLSEIDAKARGLVRSNGKEAIRVFWPIVQQLMITVSKECDTMTPMALLSNVQKCVSAFTCACELDDYLNLADAEKFRNYVYAPYNYKDSYLRIKEGLDLCFSIREKVEKMDEIIQPQVSTQSIVIAPSIAKEDLLQECGTPETTIDIVYSTLDANIYFTTNGKDPSVQSDRAMRTRTGFRVKFNNKYKGKGMEPDKTILLKLIAIVNGTSSEVSSFNVNLHKSLKFRDVDWIV